VELVKRALDSDQPLQTALFKNSTKSINALEYLLFKAIGNTSIDQARAVRAAMLAVDHISTWLEEIAGFYRTAQDAFIDGGETTVNQLVNRLIDSSYRLKNWRVGEAGGLVKKYQGKVSPELLEYPFSDTSLDAIIAILQTHREIFKNDRNADLYSLGKERDVESELAFIQQKIDEALQAANSVPRPVTKYLTSEQYQHLFKQLEQLHNAYYFMLVDALGLNSQIIDADGD
jgi:predicted lipoprotein